MGGKPEKTAKREFTVRGGIWIEGSEGAFLGVGRVVLLERIKLYGSITKAAKSMDMSYRHAWELVESMNRQSGKPLVKATTGGKGGGGTELTEAGEKAVKSFWKVFNGFESYIKKAGKGMDFC